jgi:hypothetical protein
MASFGQVGGFSADFSEERFFVDVIRSRKNKMF